jgi:hypothetical protein
MGDAGQSCLIGSEHRERLLQALNAGAPHLLACEYAGVTLVTYREQRRRDPAFALECDRVRASGQVSCLMFVQASAVEDWKVSVEFLKLTRPDLFGTSAPGKVAAAMTLLNLPTERSAPRTWPPSSESFELGGLGGPDGDLDAAESAPQPLHPGSANGQADGLPGRR